MNRLLKNMVCCLGAVALIAGVSSCVKDPYSPSPPSDSDSFFDFSTTTDITLTVKYQEDYNALFSVYTENPLITKSGLTILNPDLTPIFKGVTVNGTYSGQGLLLPTYVETIYVYCTGVGAPLVMSAPVTGTNITVDVATATIISAGMKTKAAATRAGDYTYNTVPSGFYTLGNWNKQGIPEYLEPTPSFLSGPFLSMVDANLPSGQVNVDLLSDTYETNLHITKTAGIEMTFVSAKSGYNNTFGYFTYPTATPPTDPAQVKKIVVFPSLYEYGSLEAGSRVKLKYLDGDGNWHDDFPAGTSVGFFLVTNGYGNGGTPYNNGTGAVNNGQYLFFSLPSLNTTEAAGAKQHSVLLKDAGTDRYIIGFEDLQSDHWYYNLDKDFNDVIFFVTADPRDAIDDDDIYETDDPEPTPYEFDYIGTLAFEDMWPQYGDYDMNDNMIDYTSTYTMNWENKATKIVNTFVIRASTFSSRRSGFGFQMGASASQISKVTIESPAKEESMDMFTIDAKGLEVGQSSATVIVCQDMQTILRSYGVTNKTTADQTDYAPNGYPTFTVTIEFASPLSVTRDIIAPYNPFVTIMSGGISGESVAPTRSIEVHLPNYRPTMLVNESLFGTQDDRSQPNLGLYYVSEVNFPWAIQLPIHFPIPYEKVRIDQQYPYFAAWAASKGTTHKDWYLHPRN